MNKFSSILIVLVLGTFNFSFLAAQDKKEDICLLGAAAERFEIGSLIYQDPLDSQLDFEKNWIVQQSQKDNELNRYSLIREGKLHVHDPRGCTIWYQNKLIGPIMISYRVVAASRYNSGSDIVPRDINQFWMANSPYNIDAYGSKGLFDASLFKGDFRSYDILESYYASTGGGSGPVFNETIRMRRYPRRIGEKRVDHLVLNSRDGMKDFLIVPDKEYLIQLLAADDIVQYIVDGKIVYELKKGDCMNIIGDDDKVISEGIWGNSPWTSYNEGYFGFRMIRTHHIYSGFKVYRLVEKL